MALQRRFEVISVESRYTHQRYPAILHTDGQRLAVFSNKDAATRLANDFNAGHLQPTMFNWADTEGSYRCLTKSNQNTE